MHLISAVNATIGIMTQQDNANKKQNCKANVINKEYGIRWSFSDVFSSEPGLNLNGEQKYQNQAFISFCSEAIFNPWIFQAEFF